MKRRLVFLLACHSEPDPVQHSHTGKKPKKKSTGSARCVRPPQRPRNVPESPKHQAHDDNFLEKLYFCECGYGRLWKCAFALPTTTRLYFTYVKMRLRGEISPRLEPLPADPSAQPSGRPSNCSKTPKVESRLWRFLSQDCTLTVCPVALGSGAATSAAAGGSGGRCVARPRINKLSSDDAIRRG